jgi:hypothetical protein
MSFVIPSTPLRACERGRTRTVRCQTDRTAVLGWRWQTVYLPKRRNLLAQLRIRWQVLLRRWGYA